jgi:hypothetical protein
MKFFAFSGDAAEYGALLQSQRDCVLEPRVARNEATLGQMSEKFSTPTGLRHAELSHRHNPVGVAYLDHTFPKVARSSQPWALGRNPFGIHRGTSIPQNFFHMHKRLRNRAQIKRRQNRDNRNHAQKLHQCQPLHPTPFAESHTNKFDRARRKTSRRKPGSAGLSVVPSAKSDAPPAMPHDFGTITSGILVTPR